jgi:hypothetical protein
VQFTLYFAVFQLKSHVYLVFLRIYILELKKYGVV